MSSSVKIHGPEATWYHYTGNTESLTKWLNMWGSVVKHAWSSGSIPGILRVGEN